MLPANSTLLAQVLTTPWWLHLIRGLLALLFGCYAVANPAVTLLVLVTFLGLYLLVEGIVLFYYVFTGKTGNTKLGLVFFRALLYLLAGIAVLVHPMAATLVTSAFLGWLVGLLAIFGGVGELAAGIRTEKGVPNDWGMVVLGLLSVIFGVILLSAPIAYGIALGLVFGIWAIIAGIAMIIHSFRIRAGKQKLERYEHQKSSV